MKRMEIPIVNGIGALPIKLRGLMPQLLEELGVPRFRNIRTYFEPERILILLA